MIFWVSYFLLKVNPSIKTRLISSISFSLIVIYWSKLKARWKIKTVFNLAPIKKYCTYRYLVLRVRYSSEKPVMPNLSWSKETFNKHCWIFCCYGIMQVSRRFLLVWSCCLCYWRSRFTSPTTNPSCYSSPCSEPPSSPISGWEMICLWSAYNFFFYKWKTCRILVQCLLKLLSKCERFFYFPILSISSRVSDPDPHGSA